MFKIVKRTLLLASVLTLSMHADDLEKILSTNKSMIFDYQMQSNELESDKLSKSWINPVNLRYSKTMYSLDIPSSANYTVSIDQPIFKSGGIYYAIRYSQALRAGNREDIRLQKRIMITDAVTILFNIHKNRLQQRKLKYQIKNDKIDILQKRESYDAGLLDSSFLDQALLKKSQDETSLLELEMALQTLKQQFALLSDHKPDTLKLPTLKLVSKAEYKGANIELKRDRQRALEQEYNQKMTWAKYLPTVSLQGTYTEGENVRSFVSSDQNYYTYGVSISMPLDINTFDDIEASKVAKLQAAVEVIEREKSVDQEYDWIFSNLTILDKKITLARKDVKVYRSLYKLTKDLADAGEKTKYDAEVMQNTLQIRKLDSKIYHFDKQIELLKLYSRMANVL
jgi:outer membrane protein TolC